VALIHARLALGEIKFCMATQHAIKNDASNVLENIFLILRSDHRLQFALLCNSIRRNEITAKEKIYA
jgi:hypothetical protein